jgi:hypothetical protein
MEKIHISYLTARKKYDISIFFYQHFVPDGTKIEQDYTTFDCAVLRKFFPVGNFVVHPSELGGVFQNVVFLPQSA